MARSNPVPTLEMVWAALQRVDTRTRVTSPAPVSTWLKPTPITYRELFEANRGLLRRSDASNDVKARITHVAFRPRDGSYVYVVRLWPHGPYESTEFVGWMAPTRWFDSLDSFRATLALLPIETWEDEMFRPTKFLEAR